MRRRKKEVAEGCSGRPPPALQDIRTIFHKPYRVLQVRSEKEDGLKEMRKCRGAPGVRHGRASEEVLSFAASVELWVGMKKGEGMIKQFWRYMQHV